MIQEAADLPATSRRSNAISSRRRRCSSTRCAPARTTATSPRPPRCASHRCSATPPASCRSTSTRSITARSARRSSSPTISPSALTAGIDELTRTIDTIKHQAKTVTVGISRADEELLQVPLVREVLAAGTARDTLSYRALRTLVALDPAVERVTAWTRYRVEGDLAERHRHDPRRRQHRRLPVAHRHRRHAPRHEAPRRDAAGGHRGARPRRPHARLRPRDQGQRDGRA